MELDSASKRRLRKLYPDVARRAALVFDEMFALHGRRMRVTEGYRSFVRQERLYALGRTEQGDIVTYARPGKSFHQYGLALDVCFSGKNPYLDKDPDFEKIWCLFGDTAKRHGFRWGGDFRFKDRPHIELTYGLAIIDLEQMHMKHGLMTVWENLDKIMMLEEYWKRL